MGAALFVVLDRDIEGLDTFVDGKASARSEEALSGACDTLNVLDLWSFYRILAAAATSGAQWHLAVDV